MLLKRPIRWRWFKTLFNFCSKCQKLPTKFWVEKISFYLDGTGWIHTTKPMEKFRSDRTRTWKKKGENLKKHCTDKGKNDSVGTRVVWFMVAMAHNKGVIKYHQYFGPINEHVKCSLMSRFLICLNIRLIQRNNYSIEMWTHLRTVKLHVRK